MEMQQHPCDGCSHKAQLINGRYCQKLKRYVEHTTVSPCKD